MRKVVLLLLVVLAAACAGRQRSLQVAFSSLDAAQNEFISWDERTQEKIIRSDLAPEQKREAITKHRTGRDKVVQSFLISYSLLTVASLDKSEKSMDEAINQVKLLYLQIRTLVQGNAK